MGQDRDLPREGSGTLQLSSELEPTQASPELLRSLKERSFPSLARAALPGRALMPEGLVSWLRVSWPASPFPGPVAGLSLSPHALQCFQMADQLFFIRFISFISHFFNTFSVSLVSSQVTVDFEHCVKEDNSFY